MQNYRYRVPIKNGKFAYVQFDEFADAARAHIVRIRASWTPPSYFYHFRQGGHVAALRSHGSGKWYGKIDLSRFYNNVTRHRITRRLKSIGYSFQDAEDFAIASTVKDRKSNRFVLPYGFVQSPILAALDLDKGALGKCLRGLHENDLQITVYVDDIMISGDERSAVEAALKEVTLSAKTANLPMNTAKSQGTSQTVNVFNVLLSDEPMRIVDERLAEMAHAIQQSGPGPRSTGILSYVSTVNQRQAQALRENYADFLS
jgi:reverse transcriptase-like protein